jgi:hypothetical protein
LEQEEVLLAIFRWIAEAIPVGDRWYPVFQCYLNLFAIRVGEMGGDPSQITPSLAMAEFHVFAIPQSRNALSLQARSLHPRPIARFEQQHVHTGLDKAARRGDSGGARADHDDIVLVSNFCHPSLPLRATCRPLRRSRTRQQSKSGLCL